MFIDSSIIRFFAPAERNVWFDVLIYHYIALRWSAKEWLPAKAINIRLLWSQSTLNAFALPTRERKLTVALPLPLPIQVQASLLQLPINRGEFNWLSSLSQETSRKKGLNQ